MSLPETNATASVCCAVVPLARSFRESSSNCSPSFTGPAVSANSSVSPGSRPASSSTSRAGMLSVSSCSALPWRLACRRGACAVPATVPSAVSAPAAPGIKAPGFGASSCHCMATASGAALPLACSWLPLLCNSRLCTCRASPSSSARAFRLTSYSSRVPVSCSSSTAASRPFCGCNWPEVCRATASCPGKSGISCSGSRPLPSTCSFQRTTGFHSSGPLTRSSPPSSRPSSCCSAM